MYEKIKSVTLINKQVIESEIAKLTSPVKATEHDLRLVFGEGYAQKKNQILYFAMKRKLDTLLFLNEDEYPLASIKNEKDQLL